MLKWDQKCKNFRKFPCKIKQGESQIKLSETSDYDTSLTLSKEREFEWKHSRLGQVKPYGSPQAKISHQRSPVFPGNGFASISSFLPWRRSQEVWPTQMLQLDSEGAFANYVPCSQKSAAHSHVHHTYASRSWFFLSLLQSFYLCHFRLTLS